MEILGPTRPSGWLQAFVFVLLAVGMACAQNEGPLAEAHQAALAGKYSEALATLEPLLEREPGNLEARIEYARVLSWAKRYEEALRAYDGALALDAGNEEAKVGRARVLYWDGRLNEAAAALRGVDGAEGRLLLAEVERARGHNDRALAALNPLGPYGAKLKESIRLEMRPQLQLGYVLEDDRELPDLGAAATVRAARWLSAVEFNVHPDVRFRLSTVVTQGSTSSPGAALYGASALAVSTMASIRFRPVYWLEMNLGVGGGSTGGAAGGSGIDGARHQHFLYMIHPVVRWRGLRLDFAVSRGLGDYTPLAIHNNVIEQREAVAVSYAWRRLKMGGEYWHAGYSLVSPDMSGPRKWQTSADGGAAFVTPVLYRGERMLVEVGARYEAYRFAASAAAIPSPGFFTPRSYQRSGATGHLWWRPQRRVELDVSGMLGRQRFFLFDNSGAHGFNLAGNLDAKVTFKLGRVEPYLVYGYSSAQTAAATTAPANYRVHVLGAGVTIKF